jgi:hypothetical protein
MGEEEQYLVTNYLDRRHVVAAMNGLFRRADFDQYSGDVRGEGQVVVALADGAVLNSYRGDKSVPDASRVGIGSEDSRWRLLGEWEAVPPEKRAWIEYSVAGKHEHDQWVNYGFPDFGLYIFRTTGVYLSVRCGSMGKNVIGAHAHNDQLSLELNIDGHDVITDPGSYLYMPVPELRNQYRSVSAHFTPQAADMEPSRLDEHIFYLNYENEGECLYFGPSGFVGRHRAADFTFYRSVTLEEPRIVIQDWSTTHDLISLEDINPPGFSPGYGLRLASSDSMPRS